jgi:hypothetical protein
VRHQVERGLVTLAFGLGLLDSHARTCMTEPRSAEHADAQVEELMGAVGRMLSR